MRQSAFTARHLGLLTALCAAFLALAIAPAALAHDPPQATGVFVHDGTILIRTNRGLILRESDNAEYRLLCNEAIGINPAEIPALLDRADGSWLIGSSRGLLTATADLCSLEPHAVLDGVAVPALARDPLEMQRILASTGQAAFANGLFESSDDGATFAAYGSTDQERMFDHLALSAADGNVVLASGLRLAATGGAFTTFFATSSDRGKTFTEHAFALRDDEYAVELLALHPTRRDTLFAVAHANLGTGIKDRALVSRDGASTFETLHEVDKLSALLVDATGRRIHIGARDGLWLSEDGGTTFERIQDIPIHCLARHGSTLYACEDQPEGDGVSASTDDGRTLTNLVRFKDVTSQVACSATSQAHTSCAGPWLDWLREQRAGFAADASTSAADGGGAANPPEASTPATAKESSAGCTLVAHSAPSGVPYRMAAVCIALLVVTRLRRRRSLGGQRANPTPRA